MKRKKETYRLTPHGFFSTYNEGLKIEDGLIMYMLRNKCNAIVWDSGIPALMFEHVIFTKEKDDKRTSSKKV